MTKHIFTIAIILSVVGGGFAVLGGELGWWLASWTGAGVATGAALAWGVATVNGGRKRE